MKYKLYKHAWVFDGAPHLELKMTAADSQRLLAEGGWLIRNTYAFDFPTPTPFWYVIKDSFGGMEELHTKMRNQVRKSQQAFDYRIIDKDTLLNQGYSIYCKAVGHYRIRTAVPSLPDFKQRILDASEDTDLWGAFDKTTKQLSAFAINKVQDNMCEYQTLKALPEAVNSYVYYGLIHAMNAYYLGEKRLRYVCDGARSITEHSNIQPFLLNKFRFRKAYCRLTIIYKKPFGTLIRLFVPLRKIIPNRALRALLLMHTLQNE